MRDNRTSAPATPAPLSARDMNPVQQTPARASTRSRASPIVGATGIQPQAANLGQNSPSIVTVDAVAQSQGKNASSSAAKKVMDWFRRKSLAKDTFNARGENMRSDSTSSFVRVEGPSQSSGKAGIPPPMANSSTSSVAVIPEEEQESLAPPPPREEVPVPDSATLPSAASRMPEPTRQPLGDAANATNLPRASPQRQTIGTAGRSKSHALPSPTAATAMSNIPFKAPAPSSAAAKLRAEEAKLRIHTGVVDQSALSSKLPSEVIAEVIKVLMDMGLEVKRENEYRLRCTRVKKGAARSGLRGSVMSIGGSSAGFLLGNASSSRVSLCLEV